MLNGAAGCSGGDKTQEGNGAVSPWAAPGGTRGRGSQLRARMVGVPPGEGAQGRGAQFQMS